VANYATTLEFADVAVNDAVSRLFGGRKCERSAFPQARVVRVAECGTQAMLDAVIGPYRTGEFTPARERVAGLKPGWSVLAVRGFGGYPLRTSAVETCADMLRRAIANITRAPH
jgi:hypothetical protein